MSLRNSLASLQIPRVSHEEKKQDDGTVAKYVEYDVMHVHNVQKVQEQNPYKPRYFAIASSVCFGILLAWFFIRALKLIFIKFEWFGLYAFFFGLNPFN